ncbi:MAG: DUF3488 domain-containing transglutaminase family protein [Chromatiales bacterium]|nr:DUF3488 domain-containing transglutaminase family protein [Chromatiales bacterium]
MRDALAALPIAPRLLGATLFVLAALMAPHAANLHPAILGFFYLAVGWRVLALRHPRWLPGRWLLLALMAAAIALVIMSTGLYDGRLAGTALLVVMLGLKLLELRARRDIHVTVFLGYFVVLTQFLYSQSLGLAVYLFAGTLVLTAVQVGLNRVHAQPRQVLRHAVGLFVAALPLALVVFMLFPRLHSPLWGIKTQRAFTGISGEMTLGSLGELSRSTATAFRVQFDGMPPPPEQRYWRGPVLWHTDGRRWSADRASARALDTVGRDPLALGYEITLEPTGEYWLFGLDVVTVKPPGTHLNSSYTLVSEQRVNQRLTFRAASDPGFHMLALSERERALGLQLPDRVAPRVAGLVAQWQASTDPAQPLQMVARALDFFRNEPFVYTLTPGTLQGDPVEQFLFETRRGFCEHYAGSFALLMRVAGIPARVVIGYQGGERNPHADHWVVRQSDAHAWTEVWIPGLGWWRVDPTAAVAPDRIEQPIDTAASQAGDRVMFGDGDPGALLALWQNAVWLADAVDLGWHRWVVGFSAERQTSLLQWLGLGRPHGFGLAIALLIGGALAVAVVYLLAQLPRPRSGDPLPMLWRRFTDKLRRAGVDVVASQGPDTLCAAAMRMFPQSADQLSAIRRIYVQLRYGRQSDQEMVRALSRRIRRLSLRPAQVDKG